MMYSEMSAMYRNKFKDMSVYACQAAIKDIDETLALHPDKTMADPYVTKLFCERDAALDRKMVAKF